MRGCGLEAVVRGCGPETVERGCGPEAVVRGCGPEAVVRGCGPEVVERGCGPEAVEKGCGPEAVERGCGPEVVVRRYSPEVVERGCGPEAVVRRCNSKMVVRIAGVVGACSSAHFQVLLQKQPPTCAKCCCHHKQQQTDHFDAGAQPTHLPAHSPGPGEVPRSDTGPPFPQQRLQFPLQPFPPRGRPHPPHTPPPHPQRLCSSPYTPPSPRRPPQTSPPCAARRRTQDMLSTARWTSRSRHRRSGGDISIPRPGACSVLCRKDGTPWCSPSRRTGPTSPRRDTQSNRPRSSWPPRPYTCPHGWISSSA